MMTDVHAVLQQLGWKRTRRKSIGDLEFDELWESSDPLPLLVVQESEGDFRTTRNFARRIENLAWTLHAHNNRRLLTAVLVVRGSLEARVNRDLSSRLSRFCKLIVVPSSADKEEAIKYMGSLNRHLQLPAGKQDTTGSHAESVREIISNSDLRVQLQNIQQRSKAPDDISNSLLKEFQQKIDRVLNALS